MALINYLPHFIWIVVFIITDLMSYNTLKQEFLRYGFTLELFGIIFLLLFATLGVPGIWLVMDYKKGKNK